MFFREQMLLRKETAFIYWWINPEGSEAKPSLVTYTVTSTRALKHQARQFHISFDILFKTFSKFWCNKSI